LEAGVVGSSSGDCIGFAVLIGGSEGVFVSAGLELGVDKGGESTKSGDGFGVVVGCRGVCEGNVVGVDVKSGWILF